MPHFIEIGPVVWISIADAHSHTHIVFYILECERERGERVCVWGWVGWMKERERDLSI
jgi:hypothetical protein